ncbi:MAG: ketosteroid isomerase-like protein [Patiriisocius sp.]|jgi:ketosteroid isomerase-like protein
MISQGPIEDRLAIRELIESYNDAVMRFDGDAWKANWKSDANWTLPGVGEIKGRDNFFPIWEQMMSGFSFVGFFASAGPLIIDGETAKGTWYQQEVLHGKDGSKRKITGKYTDDYLKEGDRWYFQNRIYEILDSEES